MNTTTAMPAMTFHGLAVMGLDMHLARTGLTDDEFAADLAANSGVSYTAQDVQRFRIEGFPTTWFDHTAYRLGMTGIEAVAYMLQVSPPPHRSCPSCTCGIPLSGREEIARVFLADGEAVGRSALEDYRRSKGQHRDDACEMATP